MLPVPGSFPRAAIFRLGVQSAFPSQLQSVQQGIAWLVKNYADTATYLGTPANEYFVTALDFHQVLPYTSLRFQIDIDAPTTTDEPWLANLWVENTDTTPALAAIRLAGQINDFARVQGASFPDMRSLRAVAVTNAVYIYLPWGMIGSNGIGTQDGPDGAEAAALLFGGVDNPLVAGIIGPKRHIFRVNFPFSDPYYGAPPVT